MSENITVIFKSNEFKYQKNDLDINTMSLE